MPPRALIDLAAQLLQAVLRLEQPADAVVADFFRRHRALGSRERPALAETVYAVLRERRVLEHLAKAPGGPAPSHAELARRLVLLAWRGDETLLRSASTEAEQAWLAQARSVDRAALPEPLRHNLPDWLAEALKSQLGDEFWPLVQALAAPASLDLRVNVLKARREEAQRLLAEAGVQSTATPYSPWGLRVAGKPALQRLDPVAQGLLEVQDEGSQLLALLTGARRGEMVVDFCAGAGGKTLALGAMMRNTGQLYAFDTSGHRLAALKPRLARSGLNPVHTVQIAHERDERIGRLAGKAARVLVDAPCTGLGTLRRQPDLKWRQSPAAVAESQARQQAILAAAARLVAPGGRLVYATCSLLAAENEAVAQAFDAQQGRSFAPLPAAQALAAAKVPGVEQLVQGPYLRLWPHRQGCDGFFAALWVRQ